MASPLPPSSLLSCSPFCSSSSSLRRTFLSPAAGDLGAGPRQRELRSNSSPCCRRIRRESSLRREAFVDSAVLDPPLSLGEPGPDVAFLKLKLLSAVSGLNRGLAANEEDLRRADSTAKELEAAGGVVDLAKELDKLQGKWKLIYSSAFSSRTLGGNRPGPPTGRLIPVTLGQLSIDDIVGNQGKITGITMPRFPVAEVQKFRSATEQKYGCAAAEVRQYRCGSATAEVPWRKCFLRKCESALLWKCHCSGSATTAEVPQRKCHCSGSAAAEVPLQRKCFLRKCGSATAAEVFSAKVRKCRAATLRKCTLRKCDSGRQRKLSSAMPAEVEFRNSAEVEFRYSAQVAALQRVSAEATAGWIIAGIFA